VAVSNNLLLIIFATEIILLTVMSYTSEQFKQLTETHGGYGSWAIWGYKSGKAGESNTDQIFDNYQQLHARFVILGLNISAPLDKHWQNFHGGRHDRKMKYAFNDTVVRGAYMTDIYKEIVDVNAVGLDKYIRSNRLLIYENVKKFKAELADVKLMDNSTFVVLGPENSILGRHFNDYFRPNFPNHPVIFHRHYSSWGKDEAWVESIWGALGIKSDFNEVRAKYS
jgi:hypothetical protein